jgi:hypothetical protein
MLIIDVKTCRNQIAWKTWAQMVNSVLVFRFSEMEGICGEVAELLSAQEAVCFM